MRIVVACIFVFLVANFLFTLYVWNSSITKESAISISQQVVDEREKAIVSLYGKKVMQIKEDFGLKATQPHTLEDLLNAISQIILMPVTSSETSIQDNTEGKKEGR